MEYYQKLLERAIAIPIYVNDSKKIQSVSLKINNYFNKHF